MTEHSDTRSKIPAGEHSGTRSKIPAGDEIAAAVEEVLGSDFTIIGRPPRAQMVKKRKKGRGRAQQTIELIRAMQDIIQDCAPITGRGVGYKLFTRKLIPSMSRKDMQKVYRLLKEEREYGTIPWEAIVDESRGLEIAATWENPTKFAKQMTAAYRRAFWDQQPVRCEVWSEKGTVRGLLKPVLDEYGVGFRVAHGFSSATSVFDIASSDESRPLIALYIGDYDPSGLYMSEEDLPKRLADYGGKHVKLDRIALIKGQLRDLPSFPASDKKDTRYKWFTSRPGDNCWELDAMDPNDLRDCVEAEIKELIEPEAWARCDLVNKAERENLEKFLEGWNKHEKFEQFRRDYTALDH
jgi:hypothetical protein